jgi:stearoyl-CoA desaturase (Delta-9 desaturase)
LNDPLVKWQSKNYVPLAIFTGVALPALIASLWGDFWGGLLVAGFLRIVANLQLTFLINSWCHYFGRQTYSDKVTARDSYFVSLFTYGEGYHNFHHSFEADYRNGVRLYDYDPAKWIIWTLSHFGQTYGLKRVDPQRILDAKLSMDLKRLKDRFPNHVDWEEKIHHVRERVSQMHLRLCELKKEYDRLKAEKVESMMDRLNEIKNEMKRAKRDFQDAIAHWQLILEGQMVPA